MHVLYVLLQQSLQISLAVVQHGVGVGAHSFDPGIERGYPAGKRVGLAVGDEGGQLALLTCIDLYTRLSRVAEGRGRNTSSSSLERCLSRE